MLKRSSFYIVALGCFLLPSLAMAESHWSVSFKDWPLKHDEKVAAFEVEVDGGAIASLPKCPSDWAVDVNNDGNDTAKISGGFHHGGSALGEAFFKRFMVIKTDGSKPPKVKATLTVMRYDEAAQEFKQVQYPLAENQITFKDLGAEQIEHEQVDSMGVWYSGDKEIRYSLESRVDSDWVVKFSIEKTGEIIGELPFFPGIICAWQINDSNLLLMGESGSALVMGIFQYHGGKVKQPLEYGMKAMPDIVKRGMKTYIRVTVPFTEPKAHKVYVVEGESITLAGDEIPKE
jgi:hypothetical protein